VHVYDAPVSWGYRPQLDGLRAVAVYLVLLYHAGVAAVGGGFIGVDLFFVLSGFLVTNVIWNEIDQQGRLSLGGFYARRVRRLLPAAVVVVVATCVLSMLVTPLASRLDFVGDARAALLYFANWHFIGDATDYFAQEERPSPFLHFWSLSIEEQFYIVFPLLCWLLGSRLKRSERVFAGVLAVLMVGSVVAQVVVAGSDQDAAYYGTHTRMYQLLAGALLAVGLRALARRETPEQQAGPVWAWALAASAGLVGLAVLGSDLVSLSPSNRGLLATVAAVAAIGGLHRSPRFVLTRVLAFPTVRYLGQVSYGTYLWHWPVTLVVREATVMGAAGTAVTVGVVSTALAALSYQVFETPIRRTPRLDRVPWPTVITGLAVSALVAATLVAPVLQRERTPVISADAADSGPDVDLTGELAWTDEAVPRNLPLASLNDDKGDTGAECVAGDPESCIEVDGPDSQPLVVLIGDSHAGMVLPAFRDLAEERGFRLATSIRNKCAWIQGVYNRSEREEVNEPCREQRAEFYDELLPELDADLVVLVQRSRDGADNLVADIAADDADEHPDEPWHEMMLRHATDTVDKVEATGARALIVHSVLTTNGWETSGEDPLDCLSVARTLGDCAVRPVLPPRLDSLFDYLAVARPDTYAVELRDVYCPTELLCAPVVDGFVTWKDRAHLSREYLVHLREQVWDAIAATGALDRLDVT
jgi:peptidoglycan/LPS O-acetylase OafA/YrhL